VKSTAFVLTLAALAVASSGGVAIDRYGAARAARADREDLERQLRKAETLAATNPCAFGPNVPAPGKDATLKGLAQEAAAGRALTIGYLSEGEREAEKGRRERQVIVRLVNAAHPNLILFLRDLETRGGGAPVKEIHVRPSREVQDAYEEAEIVLSKSTAAAPEVKKP
jgi:hypothetical protein